VIKVFTLAGDPVAILQHDQNEDYNGSNAQWYSEYAPDPTQTRLAGGEHAWDLLSDSKQSVQSGIYLFNVTDLDQDRVYNGRFVIVR
jgi:hypothetical protein